MRWNALEASDDCHRGVRRVCGRAGHVGVLPATRLSARRHRLLLSDAMSVALSVLRGYYPAVSNLQSYLENHVVFQDDGHLLQSDDPPGFAALVRGSYVATDGHLLGDCKFRARPPMVHLHEV